MHICECRKGAVYGMEYVFETSGIRGNYVKQPYPLPFSFYFSSGTGVPGNIRVNPVFNPEMLKRSETGTLKLCGDWEYTPGYMDQDVSDDLVQEMKAFFRKYLVLFCAVWDEQMQDAVLQDYFTGKISFDEMLQDLDFYETYSNELSSIRDVQNLEAFCRDNDLVNLYGN